MLCESPHLVLGVTVSGPVGYRAVACSTCAGMVVLCVSYPKGDCTIRAEVESELS